MLDLPPILVIFMEDTQPKKKRKKKTVKTKQLGDEESRRPGDSYWVCYRGTCIKRENFVFTIPQNRLSRIPAGPRPPIETSLYGS